MLYLYETASMLVFGNTVSGYLVCLLQGFTKCREIYYYFNLGKVNYLNICNLVFVLAF